MGKRKRRHRRTGPNPNLLKAILFAYQDPIILVDFDYRRCTWYQEGKVTYSDKEKVIAYTNGYKCQYKVAVYQFQNVGNTQRAIDRLVSNILNSPRYKGWLHHINFYRQADMGQGKCCYQRKL